MPSAIKVSNLTSAPVFPGDAAECAERIGASAPARAEAAHHSWRVLAILSALMAFASISTDLYLPAMPTMSRALGANAGTVEWTISGYLIGFILGQLFWGPIGDRHGRRLPVAIGLVLFVIGSAGCALAGSVWTMIGWRVVQAAGACAESISRTPDYGPKYVARMSQRFIDTSFGDFNGRDVAVARVQQNDAQDLLVEKLHIGAGSID